MSALRSISTKIKPNMKWVSGRHKFRDENLMIVKNMRSVSYKDDGMELYLISDIYVNMDCAIQPINIEEPDEQHNMIDGLDRISSLYYGR